eukprot:9165126-Alexandrium_andersonii.AAC.1
MGRQSFEPCVDGNNERMVRYCVSPSRQAPRDGTSTEWDSGQNAQAKTACMAHASRLIWFGRACP